MISATLLTIMAGLNILKELNQIYQQVSQSLVLKCCLLAERAELRENYVLSLYFMKITIFVYFNSIALIRVRKLEGGAQIHRQNNGTL